MRRIGAIIIALLLSGLLCPQVGRTQTLLLLGAGKGRAAPAASYMGPGDLVSGATAWWGLRCYSATYVGNVARIKSPSDALTTTITCASGGVLGETGTALATTCATSCTIDILYDQSGANACTGGIPCDAAQATEANRPRLLTAGACTGGHRCMSFRSNVANESLTTPVLASGVSQTFVVSWVFNVASHFDFGNVFSYGVNLQIGEGNSANNVGIYAGSVTNATATDGSWHAVQATVNGASSELYVDGSGSTVSPGAGTIGTASGMDLGGIQHFLDADVGEVGLWPPAAAATFATNKAAMNTNQHTFWGF